MQNHRFLNSLLALYRPEKEEIFFVITHWVYIDKGYLENQTKGEFLEWNRTKSHLQIDYVKQNTLIETKQFFVEGKYFLQQKCGGHELTSSLCINQFINNNWTIKKNRLNDLISKIQNSIRNVVQYRRREHIPTTGYSFEVPHTTAPGYSYSCEPHTTAPGSSYSFEPHTRNNFYH